MNVPLFNLGFRLFFLGAGVYSVIGMLFWLLIFYFHLPVNLGNLSVTYWHAHEMIYGYSQAVIAGFLLTAVKNWTGIQTVRGTPLLLLFSLWAMARFMWLFGTEYLILATFLDLLFALLLIVCVSYPIIKVKQWRQLAIVSKLILLAVFNLLFYLGVFNYLEQGARLGIYGGLYLVIGLILTMGRRVMPMFIENGVAYLGFRVKLFNSRWLDLSSLVLFLAFFICELFFQVQPFSSAIALCLFIVNAIRLVGWYTPGIWRRSLLWSLYLSFWFICIGFLLYACTYFYSVSKFIALHAFSVGGIGIVTMAMMSRVSIGHSGRDINNPPKIISMAFLLLLTAAAFRVIVPLFDYPNYALWVGMSQILWIASFAIFAVALFPILTRSRIDGRPG